MRTCHLHVLHVDVYALMVRTCELYLVHGQTYTAPAAGVLMSGNRGSGHPCTYPLGKFPTPETIESHIYHYHQSIFVVLVGGLSNIP